MDAITTINGLFSSLTKSEQKLAQYILNNKKEVTVLSIGELAKLSDVAESTIIRFCRKIGFKGYQDFKITLVQNIATKTANHDSLHANQYGKRMQPYFDYLIAFSPMIDDEKIIEAAKLVQDTNKICLLGAGLSGIVAEYLQTSLIRLGKTVLLDRDVHLQSINAAVLEDGDLVIAISQSGKTRDVLDSIKAAKQHKVKVLSITNFMNADINSQSDLALIAPNTMEEQYQFLPMVGQFIVIDLICDKLKEFNPEKSKKLNHLISNALINRL